MAKYKLGMKSHLEAWTGENAATVMPGEDGLILYRDDSGLLLALTSEEVEVLAMVLLLTPQGRHVLQTELERFRRFEHSMGFVFDTMSHIGEDSIDLFFAADEVEWGKDAP